MDCGEKLVVRAEIVMRLLAADWLGFARIPDKLIGNFFVDVARRARARRSRGAISLTRRARHAVPLRLTLRLVFVVLGFLQAGHFECDAKIAGAGFGKDGAARFNGQL
jgi:hypothetical protein